MSVATDLNDSEEQEMEIEPATDDLDPEDMKRTDADANAPEKPC